MPQDSRDQISRSERRKARTRAALIRAAGTFIAQNRVHAPVLEITQAADVGMGSFYNHFQSKEELFLAAFQETLEIHGAFLDELTGHLDDPAEVFSRSFRLTGRLHRKEPEISRVLLSDGLALAADRFGLAPRALRDITAAKERGRFSIADPELAMVVVAGAALTLGRFLHERPDRDDAEATDQVTEDLLRMLGLEAEEARELARSPLPELDTSGLYRLDE